MPSDSPDHDTRDAASQFEAEINRRFGDARESPQVRFEKAPTTPSTLPLDSVAPAPWLVEPAGDANASATGNGDGLPRRTAGILGRGRRPWVAAVAAAAVAGGTALAITLSNGSNEPTAEAGTNAGASSSEAAATSAASSDPGAPPSEPISNSPQADVTEVVEQFDALLDQTAAAKSEVRAALSNIIHCSATVDDVTALQSAAQQRRTLFDGLGALDVSAVSNGGQLRSTLGAVFIRSANADDAYVEWANNNLGCSGGASADDSQRRGDDLSAEARKSKRAFVKLWAPIALKYGLTQRDASEL